MHQFYFLLKEAYKHMSSSKNDFFCMGVKVRFYIRQARGKQDAVYMLINPKTNCPHTNQSLADELEQRVKENPVLSDIVAVELADIRQKVQDHPTAIYQLRCRAETKEKAEKEATKRLLPRLECIIKVLYKPQWESNLEEGRVTVWEYVHYTENTLYPEETANAKKHLMSALKSCILPVLGKMYLWELDNETQKKIIQKINRLLSHKKASASQRGYVKRAYKGLFRSIHDSGCNKCRGGIRLADMINQVKQKNRSLLNSFRISHLDENQRTKLFELLDKNYLCGLFVVSLLYCGLELCEIAALHFCDIEQLVLKKENCYIIMVTKMLRKLNKRYSSISATNDAFPIHKLRKIVLYPWTADILLKYIQHLHNQGYTDQQISQMRLSQEMDSNTIAGPKEIAEKIEPFMKEAGIGNVKIPRTRKDGTVYFQTETASVEWLYWDARYVAQQCGANQPMLHAMFGEAKTETDEESYLDMLNDQYAVERYFRLKRFSPFEQHQLKRYTLKVENNTTQPQKFQITSDYGIKGNWKDR